MNKSLILLLTGGCILATAANAQILDDSFDDGVLGTNTNGTGTGFSVVTDNVMAATETGGQLSFTGGTSGGHRSRINSNETFAANDATGVTGTFTIADFGRSDSVNTNSTRSFVGFGSSETGNSVIENAVDGLWIGLQVRENVGGIDAGPTDWNGTGGLFYILGGTVTVLEQWTWDQSLVTWDTVSTNRSDRIAMDLQSQLTLTLSSDDTGYGLSFASAAGTLPTTIAGTWADASISDLTALDSVGAGASLQGDKGTLTIDNIAVVPEPGAFALLAGLLAFGSIMVRRRR